MKTGILTFHQADNYGAVLQAYALQSAIEQIGNPVEIIDYKQSAIEKTYRIIKFNKSSKINFLKSSAANFWNYNSRVKKKKLFNNFRNDFLNISEKKFNSSNREMNYDTYIVGSDQVWNEEIIKNDKTFFLDFVNGNEKKIAYAASVGKDNLTSKEIKNLVSNISGFNFLSVREDDLVSNLNSRCNNTITHVLDPTLIADKVIWDKLPNFKRYENKKYLLIFRMVGDERVLDIAEAVAKRLDLDVYFISNKKLPIRKGFKNLRNVGPEEFINLHKNASFIVTNSFHGTAFSILFQKNFLTVPHKTRGSRMKSLLNLLKLENRIVENPNKINETFILDIDYKVTTKILEIEKEKSLKYLKSALDY